MRISAVQLVVVLAFFGCEPEDIGTLAESLDPDPCTSLPDPDPVVTHWSNSARPNQYPEALGAFQYLATDQIDTGCPGGGVYCDDWPLYPTYENYMAENHALDPIPGEGIEGALASICASSGVVAEFFKPDALEQGRLRSNSGTLQILYARWIQSGYVSASGRSDPGALATIFLPPNWDANAPAGTYPLLIRGGYDIGATSFDGVGIGIGAKIATTPGVIAIAWNGGSAVNGISAETRVRHQFQALVDFAGQLGGDKHRIVTAGCSRRGLIQLLLAANTDPQTSDYTIKFAASACAPTKGWDSGEVMEGTNTILPHTLIYVGNVVGVPDTWQLGWTYPDVGNSLTGLDLQSALARITVDEPDVDSANANALPFADAQVAALAASQVPLFLEFSSHDSFQPNHSHLRYLEKLENAGVNVEAHYVIHGGHSSFDIYERAEQALDDLVAGIEPSVGSGLRVSVRDYAAVTTSTIAPRSGDIPFAVEHGRVLYRGAGGDHPFVVTGPTGTVYRIDIRLSDSGTLEYSLTGTIGDSRYVLERLAIDSTANLGRYQVTSFARYPNEPSWRPLTRIKGTPTCATCDSDFYLFDQEPNVGAVDQGIAQILFTPGSLNYRTSWGVADRRGWWSFPATP